MAYGTFHRFYDQHKAEIDGILFDADGTLSSSGRPLPGAKELLETLDSDGFPYLLLTNDSCNSNAEKAAILHRGGLMMPQERILSAGNALAEWTAENGIKGLFFQCGKLGEPNYAELAGLEVTTDPRRIDECAGILQGEGDFNWQSAWETAFNRFLKQPDTPYIVPNPDSYWPSCTGSGMGLGAGGHARHLVQTLQDAGITLEPVYLGKPYAGIYQAALKMMHRLFPSKKFASDRLMMVGDSLYSDIRGANRSGLCSCLVLSGITTEKMALSAQGELKPQRIFSAV